MPRRSIVLAFSLMCLFRVGIASAEDFAITPLPALSSDQYSILSKYKQSSDGVVDGGGKNLRITYSSSVSLNGYVAILNDDATYNPADLYQFVLPASKNGVATVDLSALTTWTPFFHRYYLSFLSNDTETDTQFADMRILPSNVGDIVAASVKHLFRIEPYWVSSMHLLRGYRSVGVPFSLLLGIMSIAAVLAIFARKRRAGFLPAISVLLMCFLFYDARVTGDFVVHSVSHLQEWASAHTYGQAQDIYSVAEAVKNDVAAQSAPAEVSVCFNSTDYYAKLLRYLLYPVPVTTTGAQLPGTTHVVVTHDLSWRLDGDVLHCGGIDHAAQKLQSFPDGTILFSLIR